MPSVKQLQLEEYSLNTISDFFSAYQKLTIYHMKQNRNSTINSRQFFQGLVDTFVDLKEDLKRLIKSDKKNDEIITFSTLKKNGKTVSVFISFETKFSTDINRKGLSFLKESIEGLDTDIVIIGLTAKKLFSEFFPKTTDYTYFDLTEKDTSLKSNLDLVRHLLKYEKINVFNPYYVSLLEQKLEVETISGDLSIKSSVEKQQEQSKKHFLFEPDKKKILHFFEVQIMSNLFQHKIKEAHLANLGSRIYTLQETQNNLEDELDRVKKLKIKTMKYKSNKKQRNRLSGMRFWS